MVCHGIPDLRSFQDGDIVNVDVTVYYKGFHGDVNETYMVGKVAESSQYLVSAAKECMDSAINICGPGIPFKNIGKAIQEVADKYNLSVVKSYCGHGVGKLFHSAPMVNHYWPNSTKGVMKKGNVFTIEPMLNVGTDKDITWPDNWTAVTADGQRSAQFENTILITETGHEILTI